MMTRFFFIVFCLVTTSNVYAQTLPKDPKPDTVVATVGKEDVTFADVLMMREGLPPQAKQAPIDAIYPDLLESAIGQKLLAEAARRNNMDQESNIQTQVRFLTENLLAQAYLVKALESAVNEEALKNEYESYTKSLDGVTEVKARHILVKTEDEAKAIIAELEKGGDFIALAKEKSTGPSGPNGGDLGYFRKEQMVAPFAEVAFSLEPKTFSKTPVQTQFGWHVILVEDKRDAEPVPFEQAKQSLVPIVQERMQKDLLQGLRDNADVVVK